MDRDELIDSKNKQNKLLKEAFGKMMISSAPQVGGLAEDAKSEAARLAGMQKPEFSGPMTEEDELEDDVVADDAVDAPVDDLAGGDAPELDVPVDADASGIDDAAEGVDGASEAKMATDTVASAFLNNLPSDVPLESDDNGILFVEFVDDHGGPFKLALFPADMGLADVADIKEPANDVSPLDGEEGGLEDELAGDEVAPEGDLEADLGGDEVAPEADLGDEEELTEEEDVAPEGDEEVLEETCDDEHEDDEKVLEEEEAPIFESVRDQRLRKKGILGNDKDAEAEEAKFEEGRDPMRAGRASWALMKESRNK